MPNCEYIFRCRSEGRDLDFKCYHPALFVNCGIYQNLKQIENSEAIKSQNQKESEVIHIDDLF